MKNYFTLTKLRNSKLYKAVNGQMLVIFALTWVLFAGGMFTVFNVGTLVGEKMRLQNAADSAAFTGAVWEARTLNYFAYVNRSIIAELSFICYLCALTSCLDAWKTVCEYLKDVPFPPITAIFSVLYAILEVIYQILDTIVDLPWELLPQAMGGLQTAMEVFLEWKQLEAMEDIAKKMDPKIKINAVSPPDMGSATAININNHMGIRKEGDGDGLLKVLEDTIGRYTKGTYNGSLPIYNRSFEIDIPIIPFILKLVLGMIGKYELTKEKIKTSDGPGLRIYTWGIDPCSDEPGWMCWVSMSWGAFTKEKDLNLDDIRYYVFDKNKNESVGVYAVAKKKADDITQLVYQKLGGLLGADKVDLITMSKARAVYEDPNFSSNRHSTLKDDGLEPNLFNPFWKAELVSLKAKEKEDSSVAASKALILDVLQGGELVSKH